MWGEGRVGRGTGADRTTLGLARVGSRAALNFAFAFLRRAWRSGEDSDLCTELLQASDINLMNDKCILLIFINTCTHVDVGIPLKGEFIIISFFLYTSFSSRATICLIPS